MKLKDYIKKLQELEDKYPDVEVVYSKDDEGNDFQKVTVTPVLGYFRVGDFISDDNTQEFLKEYGINAVCLN